MFPMGPRSYADTLYPAFFIDFSQNSIVVIPFIINQIWKPRNTVTSIPRNAARVSPKRTKNIVMKGVVVSTEFLTDSSIVQVMRLQSIAA